MMTLFTNHNIKVVIQMHSFQFDLNSWRNVDVKLTATVGENIIATIKKRNNYGAIQSFIFPTLR